MGQLGGEMVSPKRISAITPPPRAEGIDCNSIPIHFLPGGSDLFPSGLTPYPRISDWRPPGATPQCPNNQARRRGETSQQLSAPSQRLLCKKIDILHPYKNITGRITEPPLLGCLRGCKGQKRLITQQQMSRVGGSVGRHGGGKRSTHHAK